MPAVTLHYPRNLFGPDMKRTFIRRVKASVARHMDAIDPFTGKKTAYGDDPNQFIDLVLVPYDEVDASLTARCVATIVTYDWPDRMATIKDRIRDITEEIAPLIPMHNMPNGMDCISFTFLGKVPGAWHAA